MPARSREGRHSRKRRAFGCCPSRWEPTKRRKQQRLRSWGPALRTRRTSAQVGIPRPASEAQNSAQRTTAEEHGDDRAGSGGATLFPSRIGASGVSAVTPRESRARRPETGPRGRRHVSAPGARGPLREPLHHAGYSTIARAPSQAARGSLLLGRRRQRCRCTSRGLAAQLCHEGGRLSAERRLLLWPYPPPP